MIAQRATAVAAVDSAPPEHDPSQRLQRRYGGSLRLTRAGGKYLEFVKSPCASTRCSPTRVQSNQFVIYIAWMDEHTDRTRKPRADAVRNRERVLEAAKAVFNAGGPEASLEAVAKRAGVGIGTLYRHFPTREDLFEAVYRREVEQLSELAEQLKNASDPVDALRRWLRSGVEFVATKKGMVAALALAVQSGSELHAFSFERLTKAIGSLLDRAAAAGAMRADVSPEDLLRAFFGMCYMHDQPGWQSSVLRMLDVFVDGLRVQPAMKAKVRASAKPAKPAAKRKR